LIINDHIRVDDRFASEGSIAGMGGVCSGFSSWGAKQRKIQSMGAGTIFEEWGQESVCPPLLSNFPTLDMVFWVGKSASLPTQITKYKQELFIYHNTVLFLHKI